MAGTQPLMKSYADKRALEERHSRSAYVTDASGTSSKQEARSWDLSSGRARDRRWIGWALLLVFRSLYNVGANTMGNQQASRLKHRRIVPCLDGTWNNPYDEQERTDGMKVL